MSTPYMTFDRLNETINLQNAIHEHAHRDSVNHMSTNQTKTKGKNNGYYFERKT